MAPQLRKTHPLAVISQKLSNTSADQLPYVAEYVASILPECRSILVSAPEQIKKGTENFTLLQAFKQQTLALLQSKDVKGRWAAVLIVKAAVEVGQLEFVKGTTSWVQCLLGILGKPDPAALKQAVVVTLTRIFKLTRADPITVREITTPSLPSFINSCLNSVSSAGQTVKVIKATSPLTRTVLQSFISLISSHPNIFRPELNRIKTALSSLLAPVPSSPHDEESTARSLQYPNRIVVGLAQRLYALLPQCAPKNGSSDQWTSAVTAAVDHANRTADYLFRAILEDAPDSRISESRTRKHVFNETIGDRTEDSLGLRPWSGVLAGSERLLGILQMLQAYLAAPSQLTLALPISMIWRLAERILFISGPSSWESKDLDGFSRVNPEASREEKEELWRVLPGLHHAAIELSIVLVERLGSTSLSACQTILYLLMSTFEKYARHSFVRSSAYRLAAPILGHIGFSLAKSDVNTLKFIIETACEDVVPLTSSGFGASNQAALTEKPGSRVQVAHQEVIVSAQKFLQQLLLKTRAESWPLPLRSTIDRTTIISGNEDLMTASVLNPPSSKERKTFSILPFLARAHPASMKAESLIRPRLPVIKTGKKRPGSYLDEIEDDEEMSLRQDEPKDSRSKVSINSMWTEEDSTSPTARLEPTLPMVQPVIPPEVQSPKRMRDSEDGITQPAAFGSLSQPEPKKAKVDNDGPESPVKVHSPPNEIEQRDSGTVVYSAPPPMEDSLISVTRATAELTTIEWHVDKEESDRSYSATPSIHLSSSSEDEGDDGNEGEI